jgi:hypothetical protein
MKLLPEFQIESISAIEEKKREDKISLYLRADLSPVLRASTAPLRLIIVFSNISGPPSIFSPRCVRRIASLEKRPKLRHWVQVIYHYSSEIIFNSNILLK